MMSGMVDPAAPRLRLVPLRTYTPPYLPMPVTTYTPLTSVFAPMTGASWGEWVTVGGRSMLSFGMRTGPILVWDPATTGVVARTLLEPASGGEPPKSLWGSWTEFGGSPVLATGWQDGGLWLSRWEYGPDVDRVTSLPSRPDGGPTLWGYWARADDHPVLATGVEQRSIRFWTIRTERLGPRLVGTPAPSTWLPLGAVRWVAGSGLGSRTALAAGGHRGELWMLDPGTGTELTHEGMVDHRWGCWSGSDSQPAVIVGGGERGLYLWNPTAGPEASFRAISGDHGVSLWGRPARVGGRPVIALGGEDGTVSLRDGADGARLERLGPALAGHDGPVRWGCWTMLEGRPVLATGGDDANVRLWELVEERLVSVPRYRSDAGGDRDRLSRGDEAGALAELVIARSARPPLAVGVFGDWGEGKSIFLDQLRAQIATRSRQVTAEDEVSHRAVRQVWFNAWHYAETDLWASLVAELFSQLAQPTEPGASAGDEQRRQSRLSAEIIASRGLRERLAGAETRLEDLRAQADTPTSGWERLPDQLRDDLTAAAGDRPERLYRSAVGAGWLAGRWLRLAWAVVRGTRARWWAAAVLLLAAAVAVSAWTPVPRWISAVVAAIGLLPLAGVLAGLRRAWRRLGAIRERLDDWVAGQRDRLQIPLEVATQEVADLRRQLQDLTAAGQLAGLVADQAGRSDYRSRLGLMTQIRTDFERMAALLAAAGAESDTDEAGDRLPAIDRIVVYIDDLDRCPPARVVDVLEAIHLLLAVELFVVVVAVDPRWLLQALHSHYREQLEDTGDGVTGELWQPSAVQYLEKIFQVVLTLPPLTQEGYVGLVDHLTNPQANPEGVQAGHRTSRRAPTAPVPVAAAETAAEPVAGDPPARIEEREPVELAEPRIYERGDPLALTRDEQALMHLLGPPLISTPRAVKRMANSYGLLTALRQPHRTGDLQATGSGDEPKYRAAMVLLATLVGYPELGPALFAHLHHRAAADPAAPWMQLRDELRPHPTPHGTWANAVNDGLDRTHAQQWQALTAALTDLHQRAEAERLPLPRRLDTWATWIQPVGRLSFPTGRVVSNLDRHPPLP